MNSAQLEAAQRDMAARNAIPEHFSVHTVADARQRMTVRQTLRIARQLRKKKHRDHKRYLALRRNKKVLTNAVRDELRALLVSFREMSAECRAARDGLRGVRTTAEQRSAAFQNGYRLGIEHAKIQRLQEEYDKQKGTK